MRAGITLIWGDSLGAKSFCVVVKSGSSVVVIDPGAAIMHPRFPLPKERKLLLASVAKQKVLKALEEADTVIITHYHHDHYIKGVAGHGSPYRGKKIFMKNPNTYINSSQWSRARELIEEILGVSGEGLKQFLSPPQREFFPDPVKSLREAMNIDVGDYAGRREALLTKGRAWFEKLSNKLWGSEEWVEEIDLDDGTRIRWAEGREVSLGNTSIKLWGPWFHGIEYAKTGWVVPVLIESRGVKVVVTSDVMGPIIEDYAWEIIKVRPDAILLDGPSTYLYPYMLNKVNFSRAVDNAVRIIEESRPEIIIYDHHLLRERLWRERVRPVFEAARRFGVSVLTVAEYLGRKPVLEVSG